MNHVYLKIIFNLAFIGVGALTLKANDMVISILVKKYRGAYLRAWRPTSINIIDPIQDFINLVFNWRILFRGNFIDKSNKELTLLIFLYRLYYFLFFILLIIDQSVYPEG